MAFKTEEDIYKHLYDPNIKDATRYSRETLCVWIRATIHSAISQGVILGTNREKARVMELIK